jgi:hypothetical protein
MPASPVSTRPFEKLFIAYMRKFPRSKAGNTMLLVCVDSFSKFVWLLLVTGATAAATVKVLREHILLYFHSSGDINV